MLIKIEWDIDPKDINQEVIKRAYKLLYSKASIIKRIVGEVFTKYVKSSPEWIMLEASAVSTQDGDIAGHLGLRREDLFTSLNQILETWKKSVVLQLDRANNRIDIYAVRTDYQEVLSLPVASYISYNKNGIATEIPWLRWILLEANTINIANWTVLFKESDASRAWNAIMIRRTKTPGFWSMPSPFNKDEATNFVSRIAQDPLFYQTLSLELSRAL